jgi:hypothetical protein
MHVILVKHTLFTRRSPFPKNAAVKLCQADMHHITGWQKKWGKRKWERLWKPFGTSQPFQYRSSKLVILRANEGASQCSIHKKIEDILGCKTFDLKQPFGCSLQVLCLNLCPNALFAFYLEVFAASIEATQGIANPLRIKVTIECRAHRNA